MIGLLTALYHRDARGGRGQMIDVALYESVFNVMESLAHRGLDRRRMKVGSFALLSHAVLNSGNLDRAVKHILRGFAVFLDEISADLRLEQQQAVITVANRIADPEALRFADETFLVMIHGLMCWLTGKRIHSLRWISRTLGHHMLPSTP